jgi:hypothetical protein
MKFVHHHTGEWVRPNDWSPARRYPSDAYVREYASIGEIDNAFVRQTFTWMMEIGAVVTQLCGSDVFQIRQGESK